MFFAGSCFLYDKYHKNSLKFMKVKNLYFENKSVKKPYFNMLSSPLLCGKQNKFKVAF